MVTCFPNSLFTPGSIAVFGASDRPGSVGQVVFQNLLDAGYNGRLYPVNPKHAKVQGRRAYCSIEDIKESVELAVIATPPTTVPGIIEHCGNHGVKTAVIITAGFGETGKKGAELERNVLETARYHNIRLLGPNCLGIMRPSIGLNATFYNGHAIDGSIAFVSQSGALCTAILDWSQNAGIGFSSVVSVGSSADVDFGEILDYLAGDPKTQSILMYIEGIRDARHFLNALRAAASIKPVILIKVGRHPAGSRAALSHTASLVGADDVFDAAISRAGGVRVQTTTQLFNSAMALSCGIRPTGKRLAIVTNGGGPGVIGADRATDLDLEMAKLSDGTIGYLNLHLPLNWSHGNPLDLIGNAHPDLYRHAVQACLNDENVDGVLTILTPQAMTRPLESAQILIELSNTCSKPILGCWMGEIQVMEARKKFLGTHKPHFDTPESAVEVFSFLAACHQNQKLLAQLPCSGPQQDKPDMGSARRIIEHALKDQRNILTEIESKALLSTFHIPVAKTMIARSPDEALLIAQKVGFPVAVKINSPDITHKSDVGGVLLNLKNEQDVRSAYWKLIDNVRHHRPDARMDGIAVEPMVSRPNGRELMIGVTSDPVFGPVITFGAGGTTVEIIGDRAITLPPLDLPMARNLIGKTRVSRMLGTFRNLPAVNMIALESTLLRVSEMICELPSLREMDINPLILDENGAWAVDARVVVESNPPVTGHYTHMTIPRYPASLVSHSRFACGTNFMIRPGRPEDYGLIQNFMERLANEPGLNPWISNRRDIAGSMLTCLVHSDYSTSMSLVALETSAGGETAIGLASFSVCADGNSCEFTIMTEYPEQRTELACELMISLAQAARSVGLSVIAGTIPKSLSGMAELLPPLGFLITGETSDRLRISKRL